MKLVAVCLIAALNISAACVNAHPNRQPAIPPDRLWRAVADGDTNQVRQLLENGADPNAYSSQRGTPPIFPAANDGNMDILKLLLSHGAHVNVLSKPVGDGGGGDTPLEDAAGSGRTEAVELLLKSGANVDAGENDALMSAAGNGYMDTVQALLNGGAKVNEADSQGGTALSNACFGKMDDMVKFLLAHGANPNTVDKHGNPAALWVIDNKDDVTILTSLLDHGASANPSIDGSSLLVEAAKSDNKQAIISLLAHGAVKDKCDRSGYTALMYAAGHGSTDAVKSLLDSGANVNETHDSNRMTALLLACRIGQTDTVRMLLDHGADVHVRAHSDGLTPQTPIQFAEAAHSDTIVGWLKDGGETQ